MTRGEAAVAAVEASTDGVVLDDLRSDTAVDARVVRGRSASATQ